jgi:MFS family permease
MAQTPANGSRLGIGLASFSLPAFRLLFLNGLLSAAAMNVSALVHSWLVLSLSGDSALWVGVSVALHGVGQVFFSIAGGVLVDRFNRRNVLMASQLVGSVVAGLLAIAAYSGAVWLPMALGASFVFGAAVAVDRTATTALLGDVAGRERLLNALALRRVAIVPMMVLGSLLVGGLIKFAGIWSGYVFMAVALTAAPLVLLGLSKARPMATSGAAAGFLAQAKEGFRFAAKDSQVRMLLLIAVVMEAFGFSYTTMVPVMAKNVLKVDAFGLGVLQAATGIGVGVSVLAVAFLGNFRNKPLLIFVTALGGGLSLIAFSLSTVMPAAMLFAMLTSGCLMAYDITIGALLQLVSPVHMRGRVVSLHSLAIAFMSLGGFATGAIGAAIGVPVMMTIGGSTIVGNILWRRRRLLRIRELQRSDATLPAAS